jgi:hypothetical protein
VQPFEAEGFDQGLLCQGLLGEYIGSARRSLFALGWVKQNELHYTRATTSTAVQVWGATEPQVGVISDIDDTLTDTDVTHKLDMLKNTFFHDTYDVKIFPDAPQSFVDIAGKSEVSFRRYQFSISRAVHGLCTSASQMRSTESGCHMVR